MTRTCGATRAANLRDANLRSADCVARTYGCDLIRGPGYGLWREPVCANLCARTDDTKLVARTCVASAANKCQKAIAKPAYVLADRELA